MRVSAAGLSFTLVAASVVAGSMTAAAQQAEKPLFRSSVDLVSVAAVVRDKQGRVVTTLARNDFSVIEGGEPRPVVDVQAEGNAPVSIALLVDGSGSMPRDAAVPARIAEALLRQLDAARDDAALMSFDTRLLTLRTFTSDFGSVRSGLSEIDAFGATSIYDAIAGAAGKVAEGTRKRRALVVVTDGADNASVYTADEVAWIASTIDVPVYVLALGSDPVDGEAPIARGGRLGELARATGGDFYRAGAPTPQQVAIGRIIEEIRHQYLIAFEPSPEARGLRPLEIRTRNAALKVRARRWYSTGAD